jgi:hypothetical protein
MTPARINAFRHLWAATTKRPCMARAKGPRRVTLEEMKREGLTHVVNGGYVLTPAGHAIANTLRLKDWKP